MEFNLPTWTNTPETPITAEVLNEMVEAIRYLYDNRSQVGDIVCNSNLDTMEKVIERFGGTKWEQIQGRFLLGASEEYEVGSTGGEAEHILTIEEMPEHSHSIQCQVDADSSNGTLASLAGGAEHAIYFRLDDSKETLCAGEGQPHNIMPPYEATYIWKRTE